MPPANCDESRGLRRRASDNRCQDRNVLTAEHADGVEKINASIILGSSLRILRSRRSISYMQVFHKLEDVPDDYGPTLVSVGNFDGVHRAHAHVLGEIFSRARASGGKAVAVTFEPHPTRILGRSPA